MNFRLLIAFLLQAFAMCSNAATECASQFSTCSLESKKVTENGEVLHSTAEGWDVGWHDGYVFGIATITLQTRWCPSTPFNGKQLSAVVSQYVANHPEKWGMSPDKLVLEALSNAFPCKQKRRSMPVLD